MPLAERWNGAVFARQPTPGPARPPVASVLFAVSCPAARACTSVGNYATTAVNGFTLAERWNGSAWSVQRTPSLGGGGPLAAVACPATTSCIAVGPGVQAHGRLFALAERFTA